jgi:hypothetical protein
LSFFLVLVVGTGCSSMKPLPLSNQTDLPSDEAIVAASKETHVNYGTDEHEYGRLYRGPFTIKKVAIVTCMSGDIQRKRNIDADSSGAAELLQGLVTGFTKQGFEVILPVTVSKAPSASDFLSSEGGVGHAPGSRDTNSGIGNVDTIQHYDKSASALARDTGADVFLFVGATVSEAKLYAYVPYSKFKTACEAKNTTTTFFSFNHGREIILRYEEGATGNMIGQVLARRFRIYYPDEK